MSSKLFYVVGASGSGKNAIMHETRLKLDGNHPVLFAHRYITRPISEGRENHIALTYNEFDLRLKTGLFALHWNTYGYQYGIGKEIDWWLELGFAVVVNGSREYLPTAIEKYPDMNVVLVEASQEIIQQRLSSRTESQEEIEERLKRAYLFTLDHYPDLYRINNDGVLHKSADRLYSLIVNIFS